MKKTELNQLRSLLEKLTCVYPANKDEESAIERVSEIAEACIEFIENHTEAEGL